MISVVTSWYSISEVSSVLEFSSSWIVINHQISMSSVSGRVINSGLYSESDEFAGFWMSGSFLIVMVFYL